MFNAKRISTILAVAAAVTTVPSAALATDNGGTSGGGGCHYTDSDGYDVPIDEGQDVFVDGKIVSCRGGAVVVTTAPRAQTRPGQVKANPTIKPRPKVRPQGRARSAANL